MKHTITKTIMVLSSFMCSTAFATQVNVLLSSNVKAKQSDLSFAVSKDNSSCHKQADGSLICRGNSLKLEGVKQSNLSKVMPIITDLVNKEYYFLSIGIVKNGISTYVDTCRNISLKPYHATTIYLAEDHCTVY